MIHFLLFPLVVTFAALKEGQDTTSHNYLSFTDLDESRRQTEVELVIRGETNPLGFTGSHLKTPISCSTQWHWRRWFSRREPQFNNHKWRNNLMTKVPLGQYLQLPCWLQVSRIQIITFTCVYRRKQTTSNFFCNQTEKFFLRQVSS